MKRVYHDVTDKNAFSNMKLELTTSLCGIWFAANLSRENKSICELELFILNEARREWGSQTIVIFNESPREISIRSGDKGMLLTKETFFGIDE